MPNGGETESTRIPNSNPSPASESSALPNLQERDVATAALFIKDEALKLLQKGRESSAQLWTMDNESMTRARAQLNETFATINHRITWGTKHGYPTTELEEVRRTLASELAVAIETEMTRNTFQRAIEASLEMLGVSLDRAAIPCLLKYIDYRPTGHNFTSGRALGANYPAVGGLMRFGDACIPYALDQARGETAPARIRLLAAVLVGAYGERTKVHAAVWKAVEEESELARKESLRRLYEELKKRYPIE